MHSHGSFLILLKGPDHAERGPRSADILVRLMGDVEFPDRRVWEAFKQSPAALPLAITLRVEGLSRPDR